MIHEIVSLQMPVGERLVVKKNRLAPENIDRNTKRISIVTGTHGDELNGQYVCYKLIEKINAEPENLAGIVDVYPSINPLGIDTGSRNIPLNDLDMNRVFPGTDSGAMAEHVAYKITQDIIGSDMCVDVHSSNIFLKEVPQVRLNPENYDMLLPYAKLMNADIIWALSSAVYLEASLANCLNMFGLPVFNNQSVIDFDQLYEECVRWLNTPGFAERARGVRERMLKRLEQCEIQLKDLAD